MKYDVEALWQVNYSCNFRCEYCFFSEDPRKRSPKYRGHRVKGIVRGFNKSGLVWLVFMTGGEPLLQPHFVELCKELTKKHFISIVTNLSTKNVYDFAEQVDPEKVGLIQCSLHIDERERLNLVKDFIDKYHHLRKHGFNVFASQITYPPILKRFDGIFELFKENGIIVRPKIFRGSYRLKCYPQGYTEKERRKILRYMLAEEPYEHKFMYGDLSFKGLPCKAGKEFVRIVYNGDVLRCDGETVKMGNLFEDGEISLYKEPEKCSARICPCPYYGLKYATGKYKIVKSNILTAAKSRNIVRTAKIVAKQCIAFLS